MRYEEAGLSRSSLSVSVYEAQDYASLGRRTEAKEVAAAQL